MPGVSIHVVDVARGVVAQGMRVELYALAPARARIGGAVVAANGRSGVCDAPSTR
jgi:5-hydroxyisourate hydrolase